jgi:hypothetical protein
MSEFMSVSMDFVMCIYTIVSILFICTTSASNGSAIQVLEEFFIDTPRKFGLTIGEMLLLILSIPAGIIILVAVLPFKALGWVLKIKVYGGQK